MRSAKEKGKRKGKNKGKGKGEMGKREDREARAKGRKRE